MLILSIRSDNPTAEIGLFDGSTQLSYQTWEAHRELGRTIHARIAGLLRDCDKDWHDIQGVAAFRGPGSFTGLRIGLTVANTLGYSLGCPVVGAQGDTWQSDGIERLLKGDNDTPVMPEYGAPANITQPKK